MNSKGVPTVTVSPSSWLVPPRLKMYRYMKVSRNPKKIPEEGDGELGTALVVCDVKIWYLSLDRLKSI